MVTLVLRESSRVARHGRSPVPNARRSTSHAAVEAVVSAVVAAAAVVVVVDTTAAAVVAADAGTSR